MDDAVVHPATVLARAGACRYRASVPLPWTPSVAARWHEFTVPLATRSDSAKNLAEYGVALLRRYERKPPTCAKDIDDHSSREVAGDLLGRSEWHSDIASRTLADQAIRRWPEFLLATSMLAAKPRSEAFHIFVTCGLYRGGAAVPLRWQRSFDEHDGRADDAIAQLFNTTIRLAGKSSRSAPLVCLELGLSDHLIQRMAGDDRPFVAALGPDWTHMEIHPLEVAPLLTGHSPYELFMCEGSHIQTRPRTDGPPVRLIRAGYRGRLDSRLFYAHVPGAKSAYFLVRQPATGGTSDPATNAASLAVAAAALHGEHPLEGLGVEDFSASKNKDRRWYRHMTMLQAVLTFTFTDTATSNEDY